VANGRVVTQAVSRWPVSSETWEKVTSQSVALLLDDVVLGQVFFSGHLGFSLAIFIPQMLYDLRHGGLVE
jgi:hypothetical protein